MSGNKSLKTESKSDYFPISNVKTLHLSSVSNQIYSSPLKDKNTVVKPFVASHSRSVSSTSAGSSQKPYDERQGAKIIIIDENGRASQGKPGSESNRIRLSVINSFDKEMDDFRRKMNNEEQESTSFEKQFHRPLENSKHALGQSKGLETFANYSFREDEEVIHLRVENERMRSELKFLRSKLGERENELQRMKALTDQNLAMLMRTNDQLNLLLNEKNRDIDELRLNKWKGIDKKEYEEYFKSKLEQLELRCSRLTQDLSLSQAKFEALENEKIHILATHGVSQSNPKWENIVKEKEKQILELSKKCWELQRNQPMGASHNQLLENFLLVSVEVERLHAILKGRLEEIRVLRSKCGEAKDGRPTVINSSPYKRDKF